MIYENGIVMKHVDFGRGFAVRFTGEKGTINISRDFLDSDPPNIANGSIRTECCTIIQQQQSLPGLA